MDEVDGIDKVLLPDMVIRWGLGGDGSTGVLWIFELGMLFMLCSAMNEKISAHVSKSHA